MMATPDTEALRELVPAVMRDYFAAREGGRQVIEDDLHLPRKQIGEGGSTASVWYVEQVETG
jgi:hypothetical protein